MENTMKIEFKTVEMEGKEVYSVSRIDFDDGSFTPYGSGQCYPTKEAAVIHAMIRIDADLEERRDANFVNHATRMTLRMIGSDSAY
jgi:hypothetical protein